MEEWLSENWSRNDDGIDGIIHVRRHGELTGEVIYVQIKSGDGYKSITKKDLNILALT